MKNKKAIVFCWNGVSNLLCLIVGGLYLGQHLDKTYELGGLATAGIAFAVLMSWLVHLVVLLKRFSRG